MILTGRRKVGDGVTTHGYSDAHAWTVIAVSARLITIQRDKAILLNGPNSGEPDALTCTPGGFCAHWEGAQRYRYERDPNGAIRKASLRKDGGWRLVGEPLKGGKFLTAGRHEFYDYNF